MCEPLHITVASLDERVLFAVRSQIALLANLEQVYNGIIASDNFVDDSKLLHSSLGNLEKQLKTIESKSHRLYDSFDEGIISKDLYASRSKSLEEETEIIKSKILTVKKEIRKYKDVRKTTGDFLERFKKHQTVAEIDREVLIELVDKILVENIPDIPRVRNKTAKKVTVIFKFQDEYEELQQFVNENKLVNF
jgi:hypothetical protein